jgi:deazaflavin-dependent oxidoreductase (nitroreductase family)
MAERNEFNRGIIEEFRANGGKVGGMFAGRPMVLLTTTGAKSGKSHTTPLVYLEDNGRIYVIASMGGAPNNPAWYHNLVANPSVTAEVGAETFEAQAEVMTGAERDRLYARQAELLPAFAEYQQKTTRQIPVIALNRKS